MTTTFPYTALVFVGAGNAGMAFTFEGRQLAPRDVPVYLCGTPGHPGKTPDVLAAGSIITANDFRVALPVSVEVKVSDLAAALNERPAHGRVAIIINTTIEVHDEIAAQLAGCNVKNVDIIGHPALFLGHYLSRSFRVRGVPAAERPRVFLVDVTLFASRADGATVTLTGKKDNLEIACHGDDITSEDISRVAAIFGLPSGSFTQTDPLSLAANVANPAAHGYASLDLLPRVLNGEKGLLFYADASKEAHDKSDRYSEAMANAGTRLGLNVESLMDKANRMYPGKEWVDYDDFAHRSTAHNTIPAFSKADTRTIWEELVITDVLDQCFERMVCDVPELTELTEHLDKAVKEHMPHRLASKITLADLGIGPEHSIDRFREFLGPQVVGLLSEDELLARWRARFKAVYNGKAEYDSQISLSRQYRSVWKSPDDQAKVQKYWAAQNQG